MPNPTPASEFDEWYSRNHDIYDAPHEELLAVWNAAFSAGLALGREQAAKIAEQHHAAEAPDEELPCIIAAAIRTQEAE